MSRSTVADVLADGIARAGAARLFLAPGGLRATAEAAAARGLSVVETRTELGACLMAVVTGDLGDAPGVAVSPCGAGAVEAVACAARLRAPLLLVTERHAEGPGLAVKASLDVDAESSGHWTAHAARLAMTPPRGPVHLRLASSAARAAAIPVATSCRLEPRPAPSSAALDGAAATIREAARPLVVAGRGCGADAAPWLRAFAESVPAPVLVTPRGKGALADPHPLALGVFNGDHPLLERADLIVLLGVDDAATDAWPSRARLLRLEDDPTLVLAELADRLRGERRSDWDIAELDRVKRRLGAAPAPLRQLVALVREATPGGTRATSDLAIADLWQAVQPGDYLADPEMPGFALAAALAASLVDPARRAVAFTDARGLAAQEAELAAAEALGVPIVVVVAGAAGVSSPDELSRAFDDAWRTWQSPVVRVRVDVSELRAADRP